MKIKAKLTIALTVLFALIVMLAALAVRQVNLLAEDTENILEANYQSLEYSRNMYKLLDNPAPDDKVFEKFIVALDRQKSNITEVGEKELTADLQQDFDALIRNRDDVALLKQVRKDINSIMKLNMDAIKRKSNIAGNTAKNSILWLSITSSFCLIIGFTLIFNLPGYIANPIRDLTESIRQIAAKNYAQRVYFKGHDEFSVLAKSFNTMAEKLQEYNDSNLEKLLMEKKRIETLVNNLHDPVIGLDEKNTILFINEKALQVSGLKKEAIIGQKAEQVAVYNDLVRSLLQENDATLKIYADNKESYFEKLVAPISIIPTGETDDKHIGSFIILRNVTPYKELDLAKTNFIATVSHEFKTPIAAIKMGIQLLENEQTGSLNPDQKHLISGLKDDTERLLRTTGELLNITQVETGKTALNIEPCPIDAIINAAVESNNAQAMARHIVVKSTVIPGLPPILADKEKAVWIVSNLISNAIRYSHENAEIDIYTESSTQYISIVVKDNGIGIADTYLPRIFDKYFRVPGTQKEGTGLGLAISKEFMEAQNGFIDVKSIVGQGTVFTLNFRKA